MKSVVAGMFAVSVLLTARTLAQTIQVSSYPALGQPGVVSGVVQGVEPSSIRLAIVNDVFGTFWSKPFANTPYVTLRDDGAFDAHFQTGGQDHCAHRVHFFAVPTNISIPTVLGGSAIPAGLLTSAVATYTLDRTPTNLVFSWKGRTWTKKDTGVCNWGPGPNHFAASEVYVDTNGHLRLRIRFVSGNWRCGEVVLEESLGYGIYRFYINSDLSSLPPSIVGGWFTYDDDAAYAHREIDVEFSNGPVVGDDAPWQYVIQPYFVSGQRERFVAPLAMSSSIHTFTWLPQLVSFASYDGPTTFSPEFEREYVLAGGPDIPYWGDLALYPVVGTGPTNWLYQEEGRYWHRSHYFTVRSRGLYEQSERIPFKRWSTSSGVPPRGNEKIRMNLWLHNGEPPGNTNESYEVVITNFEFVPLSENIKFAQPRLDVLELRSSYERSETKVKLRVSVPAQ